MLEQNIQCLYNILFTIVYNIKIFEVQVLTTDKRLLLYSLLVPSSRSANIIFGCSPDLLFDKDAVIMIVGARVR